MRALPGTSRRGADSIPHGFLCDLTIALNRVAGIDYNLAFEPLRIILADLRIGSIGHREEDNVAEARASRTVPARARVKTIETF